MPWGAAIAGVAGLASAAVGSQNSGGQSSTGTSAPWGPQQPYLEYGFGQAQNIYNQRSQTTLPTQYVAGGNADTTGASNALYTAGMGAGSQFAPWTSAGEQLAGNAGAYSSNAGSIASSGIGQMSSATNLLNNYAQTGNLQSSTPGINTGLQSAETSAAQGGLSSLGSASSLSGQVGAAGMNGQGAANAGLTAGQNYLNSAPLQQQIQAADMSVNQNLTEDTLPQIREQAMAAGGANSSREGALEGMATQAAGTEMAQNAASLEGNAFNTGASLGSSGYTSGLSAALGAANAMNYNGATAGGLANSTLGLEQNASQFGTSSQLGAAQDTAANTLNYQTANTNAQLAANSQIGQGLNYGMSASQLGYGGAMSGLQSAYGAGIDQQQQAQLGINNNLDVFNAQDQRQQSLLQQYQQAVTGNFGGTTAGTTTPNNGGLSGAFSGGIGGATAAYGLYNNYNNGTGMFSGGGSSGNPWAGAGTSAGDAWG